jgi:hypothetical protein
MPMQTSMTFGADHFMAFSLRDCRATLAQGRHGINTTLVDG